MYHRALTYRVFCFYGPVFLCIHNGSAHSRRSKLWMRFQTHASWSHSGPFKACPSHHRSPSSDPRAHSCPVSSGEEDADILGYWTLTYMRRNQQEGLESWMSVTLNYRIFGHLVVMGQWQEGCHGYVGTLDRWPTFWQRLGCSLVPFLVILGSCIPLTFPGAKCYAGVRWHFSVLCLGQLGFVLFVSVLQWVTHASCVGGSGEPWVGVKREGCILINV